ncbi:MAG: hypothetical protein LBU50_07165 [Cellulomonas sp.]|nr:hypothetical protein [Cellulomonas sp.]
MSHRSCGPIRLFAASFLFTASIVVGAGGALAVTADPDGQSGAATTVSPTPLPAQKPTCPPTETAAPAPHAGSIPTDTASAAPAVQKTDAPSPATPTATAAAKSSSPLARTGSNIGPIAGVLAVALAVGGVLVVVARRRATR